MMSVQIGFAETPAQRQAIYRLRYEIYIEEMGFQYAADHQRRLLADEPQTTARLMIASVDEQIVATLRLQLGADAPFTEEEVRVYNLARFSPAIRRDQMAIMSRFMTRAPYRGTDIPLQLLQAMFTYYLDQGIHLAFLDCRPHLLNLYQRLGYRPYTKAYNDPVAGLLVPLVLVISDVAHLERVNSPFLPQARARMDPASGPEGIRPLLALPPVTDDDLRGDSGAIDATLAALGQDQVEQVAIFAGLTEEEVNHFLRISHIIDCSAGDRIITQGNVDLTLFIILQGTVEAWVDGHVVAIETAGSLVGEVAFLLKTARTADVVAASDDVRVLCLRHRTLEELMTSEPRLAARLFYNLSRILAVKFVAKYT